MIHVNNNILPLELQVQVVTGEYCYSPTEDENDRTRWPTRSVDMGQGGGGWELKGNYLPELRSNIS